MARVDGDRLVPGEVTRSLVTGFLGRLPVDPIPQENGQWWYNTTEELYKYYDGKSIREFGPVHVGPTPPPDPKKGSLWWDTVEERLKVYQA